MQRRSLLVLGALVPVAFLTARYLKSRPVRTSLAIDYRQQALRLNDLAANLATPDDALRLVDFVADMFLDKLPSALSRKSFRKRVAQAEFAAVSDATRLIPEERIAAAWNAFAATIGAPQQFQVTEAEVHYHRDSLWTSARLLWSRGRENLWAVPTIYATRSDGSPARGCRPLEAFRILWDFANMPGNLMGTREQVAKGELFSETVLKPPAAASASSVGGSYVTFKVSPPDPMALAQRQFVADKGTRALNAAVVRMLERTLA